MAPHSTPLGEIGTDPLVDRVRGCRGESVNLGGEGCGNQVKVEWPSILECHGGILWSKVIQDFWDFNLGMSATRSTHRGRHGNRSGTVLNEVFYRLFQGLSTKFVIGQSEQHALQLGR